MAALLAMLQLIALVPFALANVWSYTPDPVPVGDPARKYESVRMNFLWPDFIADGLSGSGTFFKDEIRQFCDRTGAVAEITPKAFPADYRDEMEKDLANGVKNGTYKYDTYNFFGSWMPGLVEGGHLLALTDRVKKAPQLEWADILPAVRRGVAEYKQQIYMLPADGDVIVMIYRRDLLDKHGLQPPTTWQEFLTVSKYFREAVGPDAWKEHNRTLDQEGGGGACMMTKLKDWAYANLFAYLATFLQAHGPTQGIFFDPETMRPLFQTAAAREALLLYKEIVDHSTHVDRPCKECTDDGGAGLFTMVGDMQAGKCMMGFNYMGPIKFIASGGFNVANNTIALSPTPGSTWVKAADSDTRVECSEKTGNCPNAVLLPDGNGGMQRVNRATYYSGGGQSWAISSHSEPKTQDALWELLLDFINKKNSILSTAAADYLLDPFRQSSLDGLQERGSLATDQFMANGWKWEQLGTMQSTLQTVFTDPNSALDLKIIEGGNYIEDTDPIMLQYLSGNMTVDGVIAAMTKSWNDRTESLGFERQRNLYRQVLGLQPIFNNPLCDAGTHNVQGRCMPCDTGFFKSEQSKEPCLRCPRGTYADQLGSSACHSCEPHLESGTTEFQGSLQASDCVCAPGSFDVEHICVACSTGMSCEEFGLQGPKQEGGYRLIPTEPASGDYSAFRCTNKNSCPKGELDTCAETQFGVSCGRCIPAHYDHPDKACQACVGKSTYPAMMATLVILSGAFLFAISEMMTSNRQGAAARASMVALDRLLWATQVFGVMWRMPVKWQGRVRDALRLCSLATLDASSWRGQCFLDSDDPVVKLAFQVLALPMLCLSVGMLMVFIELAERALAAGTPRGSKISVKAVFNVVGGLLVAGLVSMMAPMLRPMQCMEHPNGQHSVMSDMSVLCWEGGEHGTMVFIGILGLLVAVLPLLATVGFYCVQYPVLVSAHGANTAINGNMSFVFQRFKPSCYHYPFLLMVKNVFIVLIPVVFAFDALIQLTLLGALLIGFLVFECIMQPWRTEIGNMATFVTLIATSFFLQLMGCLFTAEDIHSEKLFVSILSAIVIAMAVTTLCTVAYCLWKHVGVVKDYGVFVSYHGASSGCLARWMKLMIERGCRTRVYLDCDEVGVSTESVVETVAFRCRHVLALFTTASACDTRCAAEIATAFKRGVSTHMVVCGPMPKEMLLRNWENAWSPSELHELASCGVKPRHVRDAYATCNKVRASGGVSVEIRPPSAFTAEGVFDAVLSITRPSQSKQRLSGRKSASMLQTVTFHRDAAVEEHLDLMEQLMERCFLLFSKAAVAPKTQGTVRVLIVGVVADAEACSACDVLAFMLQRRIRSRVMAVRSIGNVEDHAEKCTHAVLVLSRGALQDDHFLQAARRLGVGSGDVPSAEVLAVSVDPSFVLPSTAGAAKSGGSMHAHVADVVGSLTKADMFEFSPTSHTSLVESQASLLSKRIQKRSTGSKAVSDDNVEGTGLELSF